MTPTPPTVPAPRASGDRLAVILGSGLAQGVLSDRPPDEIATSFGPAELHDLGTMVVAHRHHVVGGEYRPPHRLDHHRTIAALCAAGCDRVLAIGSTGALRGWPVGTVAAVSDVFAPWANPSFHEDAAGHGVPTLDPAWRAEVLATWRSVTATEILDEGIYAQTIGPRFETPAEVRFLAQHADLVGMTIASESILANEAGLAYAAVCVVDNVGNGLAGADLTVDEFRRGVEANRERLIADLAAVLPQLATTGGRG